MFGFKKLKEKLAKTKNKFVGKIAEIVRLRGKVDEELLEELEEILIEGDVGADVSFEIVEQLRQRIRLEKITDTLQVQKALQEIISDLMLKDYNHEEDKLKIIDKKPFVILFTGVNGVGKTTTIGKLAKRYSSQGKKVMLIAGDTFRAAAIEQLTIWSERSGVLIEKKEQGSDPSSVIFDGLKKAVELQVDIVMIDTAGRQQNRVNLMNELQKIGRTIQKVIPDAPHESLLVVDATTGQNAISQAKLFNQMVPLSGLVLTKLDGTAKGGVVIGIKHSLNFPVKLIGVGEKVEDLDDFNAEEFVKALFAE